MAYSRRFWLLITSFIICIIMCVFVSYESIKGNASLLIISAGLIFYSIFVFKLLKEEYEIIKLDKENGIESGIFTFSKLLVFSKSTRDDQPALPIATFIPYGEGNPISLGGDYSKVSLQSGVKYRIWFYRYAKVLVDIEEVNYV